MPTSTRFAVAVHVLAALAVSGDKPLRSEDLAYWANTGAVVIRGLLSRLNDAGLTRSQLGAGGGAMLAKPAAEIRLLDVYAAVEDTELFSVTGRRLVKAAPWVAIFSMRCSLLWPVRVARWRMNWQKPPSRTLRLKCRAWGNFPSH